MVCAPASVGYGLSNTVVTGACPECPLPPARPLEPLDDDSPPDGAFVTGGASTVVTGAGSGACTGAWLGAV